jgi:ABC-type glycerol-3-phosphate transport system substrate-binding protein
MQTVYKTDKALLENAYISDFRTIVQYEKADFDAPVTFLGFPNSTGTSGVSATLSEELAIMAKAKNPDGAWEFVKGFISDRNPKKTSDDAAPASYGVYPILQSNLDNLAEDAKSSPYYFDEQTHKKVFYDNTAWVGNSQITLPNNTDADNQRIYDLINSIDTISRSENDLQKIIDDDMKAFTSGQKTAAETAAIIQNRAQTYVSESR